MACWVWFFSVTILVIGGIPNSRGNLLLTTRQTTTNNPKWELTCYYKGNFKDSALVWKFPINVPGQSLLHYIVTSNLTIEPKPDKVEMKEIAPVKHTSDYPHFDFGPTDDARWNVLDTINVTSSTPFKMEVKKNASYYKKHFSILSRNSFDMTITDDQNRDYLLQFGYKANLSSEIQLPINTGWITLVTTVNGSSNEAKYSSLSTVQPNLRSGSQWVNMSISINAETRGVSVWIEKDQTPVSFSTGGKATKIKFSQKFSGAFYYLKVHDHPMAILPEDGTGLEAQFQVPEGCIFVTYMSVIDKMTMTITGGKNEKKEASLKATNGRWRVERIKFPFHGSVKVKFAGKSLGDKIQAIGALRSCSDKEYSKLVTVVDNTKLISGVQCVDKETMMKIVSIIDPTTDRKAKKFEDIDDTFKDLIEEKDNVCDADGCSCMGSNGQNCENSCSGGTYGFNCANKCNYCINQSCRKTDGICTNNKSCLHFHRPPFCKEKLLDSGVPPEIKQIGNSWVEVDITKAFKYIEKNNSDNEGKQKVKISYLNLTAVCANTNQCKAQAWKYIPWKPRHLQHKLKGLNSGTEYKIQLLVHENGTENVNPNENTTADVKTKNCTQNPQFVTLRPSNTSLTIDWEKGENFCPPQDYDIKIQNRKSQQPVNVRINSNTIIDGLTPNSEYLIIAELKGKKMHERDFNTTEGAPEPVKKLNVYHEAKDSKLVVNWKKPETLNGELKGYTIELIHQYFVACGKGSADSRHNEVKEVNETVESVSFSNLAIFSSYTVVVTARTSAMKGKPSSLPLSTPEAIKINESPTLDHENTKTGKYFLNITWNPPDCRKAGCTTENEYLIKVGHKNETIEIVNHRFYNMTNLTKNTEYSVHIEARCKGSGGWLGEKGLLALKIETDQFDVAEIVGISCGSILVLLLIAALVFLVIWRYRRSQNGYVATEDGEEDKLPLRYLPAPKRHGQLVKKVNFAGYVSKARANGSLKKDFELLPSGQQKEWLVGITAENKQKNRYAKLLAYDHSRVTLGDQGAYINANFISDESNKKKYIASQGPLEKTTTDFWQMIWQEEVDTVVMLTKLVEKTTRCHKYWPDVGCNETFGEYFVQNVNELAFPDHVERTLSLTGRMGHREVLQLHYTAWPHQGVPEDIDTFARFMGKVLARETSPLLIHCSGGTGRTGTVILIDACLRKYRNESMINVWAVAERMRQERVNMIENKAQYEFAHVLLSHYLTQYG
ncbi:receptor-type tyrosine-protein phosphatase eta-like isoform X2 [Cloeon dipterum]|uniref:receptor-type tyrosine-protein phosphatase eta-like isoform X2 n=1 Tax=Cloeon dipterum TaxID=197152 RepID=UPI00321FF92D